MSPSPSRSGRDPAPDSAGSGPIDSPALMTNQRRVQIAAHVQKKGVARVSELAGLFQVSQVTIRSDLVSLEQDGLLRRDRGGAVAKEGEGFVTHLIRVDERATLHLDAKKRIARAAAKRIAPGNTILLDAGTTVLELARVLKTVSPMTIVTNAINIALEFAHSPAELRLILLGGTYNRESGSTLGSLAVQNLEELVVQKLFLGAQAVDISHGLTDSTMEIAQVKRAMINAAREVILLTDSSKWGWAGFCKVAPLAEVDTIITDDGLPPAAREAIEQAGIELVIV